jgi:uncharacterized protein YbaA (DUF1428 family)
VAARREADETVVLLGKVPHREVRDEAWKKAMIDPRTQLDAKPMPFDGKRLVTVCLPRKLTVRCLEKIT